MLLFDLCVMSILLVWGTGRIVLKDVDWRSPVEEIGPNDKDYDMNGLIT